MSSVEEKLAQLVRHHRPCLEAEKLELTLVLRTNLQMTYEVGVGAARPLCFPPWGMARSHQGWRLELSFVEG